MIDYYQQESQKYFPSAGDDNYKEYCIRNIDKQMQTNKWHLRISVGSALFFNIRDLLCCFCFYCLQSWVMFPVLSISFGLFIAFSSFSFLYPSHFNLQSQHRVWECFCAQTTKHVEISRHPLFFSNMTFQIVHSISWACVISFPFYALSPENKPWYINLISGICVLIKGEFTSPAGGIIEHMNHWGMWQMATFNKAVAFML